MTRHYLHANWPAPEPVKAFTTTRTGGCSEGAFDSFNVGLHVGDNPSAVLQNRQWLQEDFSLPHPPHWLHQVHGTQIARIDSTPTAEPPEADAAISSMPHQFCVVMTADCLPILLCDQQGTIVSAIHGGWRGLQAGIVEKTIAAMGCPANEILAWLGPAIGPQQFEVGIEVVDAFVRQAAEHQQAFIATDHGRYLANIFLLATQQLQRCGVMAIYSDTLCTVTQPEQFFSYRHDGGNTGRMASLIGIFPDAPSISRD